MAVSITQNSAMASHFPSNNSPRKPMLSAGLPSQPVGTVTQGLGYAQRFRRIRSLHHREATAADIHKMIEQSLPKMRGWHTERDRVTMGTMHKPHAMNIMQLPAASQQPLPAKRQSLPMKTFNFRVPSEHSTFVSKSVPSLPSIPGSPSFMEDPSLSPVPEKGLTERSKVKVSFFPSKHRFEKMVVQKQLHSDWSEGAKRGHLPASSETKTTSTTTSKHAKTNIRGHSDPGVSKAKSHNQTNGTASMRYSKRPGQQRVISASVSEPSSPDLGQKWKEDCRCLRCQMLRRQFEEGDCGYWVWGRYPCHHVDPAVSLDD